MRLGAYPTSVVTRRAGPGGIAQGQAFSGGGQIALPDLSPLLSSQLTVAFVLRTDGTANNGFGDLGTSVDAEHYPYSGVLYLSGGTSSRQNYTPTGVDLTRPHCTVISSNATTSSQRATIDGRLIGTASISAIGWATTPLLFVSSGFGGFGGEFYGFFAWNRALSDAEAREVSLNPWQLFEPRRLYSPTAAGGAGSNTIAVPSGAIVLAGFAPVVTATANQTIAVPAGTLTLSAFAPTVTAAANQTIAVPAGALVLAAFAPTVSATANNSISVPAGALTLAGYAPTVTSNASNTIAVPAGSLSLAAYAPDVLASTNYVSVPAGALTITGFAPRVSDGSAVAGFLGGAYFDVLSGRLLILRGGQ